MVLILRWFWWRINAWSEIAALASSLATILVLILYTGAKGVPLELRHQILVVPVSIICWVAATFATAPESWEKLSEFYSRVRPPGLWSPVRRRAGIVSGRGVFSSVFLNWSLVVSFLLCFMIGTGKLVLGDGASALWLLLGSAIAFVLILRRSSSFFR